MIQVCVSAALEINGTVLNVCKLVRHKTEQMRTSLMLLLAIIKEWIRLISHRAKPRPKTAMGNKAFSWGKVSMINARTRLAYGTGLLCLLSKVQTKLCLKYELASYVFNYRH